jgi:hypothetical protein
MHTIVVLVLVPPNAHTRVPWKSVTTRTFLDTAVPGMCIMNCDSCEDARTQCDSDSDTDSDTMTKTLTMTMTLTLTETLKVKPRLL